MGSRMRQPQQMDIWVFFLLLRFACARCLSNGTAATSNSLDKKQTISFGPNSHYIAKGSPLLLNCTSWNDNLSSYNLCWRFKNKAWLNDRTTRLDARTVQLYIPNVTYVNNGTYQCCSCNATLSSGVTGCDQTNVVFIGEKPDARYLVLGVQISPYGCPPELIDLSWKASPSNGELLEYNVWYEIGDHVCPAVSHMKRASWCTRHSFSSDASFSCDLKRIVNRSNGQKVCLEYRYPLCWSISVTNRFGTESLSFPYVTHFYIDTLCPRPSFRLWTSGKGEITVEIDPLKQLLARYLVRHNVTFCYLGTGFIPKEVEQLETAKIQFTRSYKSCESQITIFSRTSKLVKTKLGYLKDYSRYAVSVSGNLLNGNPRYGLVAGPYNVTTLEQAPAEAPSLYWTTSLTSCGSHKTVAVHFELPPVASWRGRPRQFIMEYWQTGNQTRMNKTFPTNVRQLTSSAALSVNVTVECYKEYKVKMRMCTVECGEWSTVISIPADKQSSTLAAFRKKGSS